MKDRKSALHLILLAGFSLAVASPNLDAQIVDEIEARVPFSFVVADRTLDRGHYVMRLRRGEDPSLEVRGTQGQEAVVVPTTISVGSNKPPQSGLSFNQYENERFLAKILIQGSNETMEIEPSDAERRHRKLGHRPNILFHPAKHR